MKRYAFFFAFSILSRLDIAARTEPVVQNSFLLDDGFYIFLIKMLLIAAAVAILALLHKRIYKLNTVIKYNDLLKNTLINMIDTKVFIKNADFKYVLINPAFALYLNKPENEIIGLDDSSLTDPEFADWCRKTDLEVLNKKVMSDYEYTHNGRVLRFTKYPVQMQNGKYGIGAYIKDLTDEREQEKRQEKVISRHTILTDVITRSFKNNQEQLDYMLHRSLELTESQYGYIYLYDEKKREFTLNSWSKDVHADCKVENKKVIYPLDETGIGGEVVRQRIPIVINDFERVNPMKKGFPEGHVKIKRFLSIPVIIDDKVVAVVGLANKSCAYDDNDVYGITLLMSGVWNAVKRKEAQDSLVLGRDLYLKTLVSIADGVIVIGNNENVTILNHVAEKITGWTLEEAAGRHYKDVFVIEPNEDNPIEKALKEDVIQNSDHQLILVSKNGRKYYLECSVAPVKDDSGNIFGAVLVMRDDTYKTKHRKEIEFLSFHDSLTGLYNRRYFEEELRRLDVARTLPISIIIGDANGLKLINDIFGHSYGDKLLVIIAGILKSVSRSDDIIARWGGDEFVMLLPKTGLGDAQKIIARVKDEFKKEHIQAISGSISLGAGTKTEVNQKIWDVLALAEERMYLAKTLERDEVRRGAIESIIKTLHDNSPREKVHSVYVSELCQRMGRVLNLSDIETKKLKDAGYLHDIGKIVLDNALLRKYYNTTDQEWNEIKKHPIIGFRILNSFDHTLDLAESVLAHQERWDGSGYPKGLKGEEIPLLSRIIAIAESYERKLAGAENTKPMSKREALQAVKKDAGTHFDPALTDIFLEMIEKENL